MMEGFKRVISVSCASCYKDKIVPDDLCDAPEGLVLFEMYIHGWTNDNGLWYCPKCKPEEFKIDPSKHPYYHCYRDYWSDKGEKSSHYFEKESYDPYASMIRHDMCNCCRFMRLGYEEDGSSWRMCMVENPGDSYGHNLYAGHFYGDAIAGRLCPYFTCRKRHGRDPLRDKADGTFHVPYNEEYDGD